MVNLHDNFLDVKNHVRYIMPMPIPMNYLLTVNIIQFIVEQNIYLLRYTCTNDKTMGALEYPKKCPLS